MRELRVTGWRRKGRKPERETKKRQEIEGKEKLRAKARRKARELSGSREETRKGRLHGGGAKKTRKGFGQQRF